MPDARAIADELTARQVRLNLGGSVYDPNDAVGRLLFNVLAMVAEFESDLIRLRTREGKKIAKAKGRLRGKQPKLNPRQEAHLVELFETGEHSTAELADLFGVGRSTVYRALERNRSAANWHSAVVPQAIPLRDDSGDNLDPGSCHREGFVDRVPVRRHAPSEPHAGKWATLPASEQSLDQVQDRRASRRRSGSCGRG